jgi:chromosomal replication initiation ATPase DnaA
MSRGAPTLDTVMNFLLGHGTLFGCKFGEIPDNETSSLWWRRHVREAYGELGALELLEVNTIVDVVADHYRLRRSALYGSHKNASIVRARQVAMYLARTRTKHSLHEIGRCFNRDHTCVVLAVRRISENMVEQPAIAQDVQAITKELDNL